MNREKPLKTKQSRLEANARWDGKQDRYLLRFRAGQKSLAEQRAQSLDMSLNRYIQGLLDKDLNG